MSNFIVSFFHRDKPVKQYPIDQPSKEDAEDLATQAFLDDFGPDDFDRIETIEIITKDKP